MFISQVYEISSNKQVSLLIIKYCLYPNIFNLSPLKHWQYWV